MILWNSWKYQGTVAASPISAPPSLEPLPMVSHLCFCSCAHWQPLFCRIRKNDANPDRTTESAQRTWGCSRISWKCWSSPLDSCWAQQWSMFGNIWRVLKWWSIKYSVSIFRSKWWLLKIHEISHSKYPWNRERRSSNHRRVLANDVVFFDRNPWSDSPPVI